MEALEVKRAVFLGWWIIIRLNTHCVCVLHLLHSDTGTSLRDSYRAQIRDASTRGLDARKSGEAPSTLVDKGNRFA